MSAVHPHLASEPPAKRPLPAQAHAHARPQSQPQPPPPSGQFNSPRAVGTGMSPGPRGWEGRVGARQGLTPWLGQGLTPGLGQGLTPGLGQGLTPGLGQGLTPGLGQGFAGWSTTSIDSTTSQVLVGFDSPAILGGLGIGALDGGVGMGISMSSMSNLGLGLSTSGMGMGMGMGMGKVDDGERRRRLEAVLATLGQRHGRVSQEGLERLSRRFGLEVMWDEGRRDGKRTLSMAGFTIVVDVNFDRSSTVENVALQFANTSDPMTQHAESVAAVLREDLKPPPGVSNINAMLAKFANNLERLARMDKLSTPSANCFEAVFGVYTSLKRLYEHNKKAAEEVFGRESGNTQERIERHVVCKAHGRPSMHARRRVGLSLDYWADQHLVPQGGATAIGTTNDSQMDVDLDGEYEEVDNTYSMVIECEPSPPALYPSIRVSNDWLSEQIDKAPNDLDAVMVGHDPPGKLVLNWLDPPSASILDVNGTTQIDLPHARFVAKLEPPIILPLSITMQLYASVGINIGQETAHLTSLDGLMLPDTGPAVALSESREVRVERGIPAFDHNAQDVVQKWNLGLFLTRTELGRKVDQVPFFHPRQLVALLPILRQYAFITRLLRNSFTPPPPTQPPHDTDFASIKEPVNGNHKTLENELAALLAPSALSAPPRALDVAFSTIPSPHITLVFPTPDGVKKVTFDILPDAEVVVSQQDLIVVENSEKDVEAALYGNGTYGRHKSVAALAQALMICEDLCTWAEWVRKRYF